MLGEVTPVLNRAKYESRHFQDWHREYLPASWYAGDIDLFDYCFKCASPLWLNESSERDIASKMLGPQRKVASLLDIPVYLVRHMYGDREPLGAWRVTGRRVGHWIELKDLLVEWQGLRDQHVCD